MSKFYVGQRVRIVGCSPNNAARIGRFIGTEGRIIAAAIPPCSWFVDSAQKFPEGLLIAWQEKHLEPLTDPGREVVSWDECVWKPEHLRTDVTASTPKEEPSNV